MKIAFNNRRLEKCANNDKTGLRTFGDKRFKKFKMRLDQLRAATTLEDTRNLPGRFHELTGDRKGQWSCSLDDPYRLIFTPQENPIPVNEDGQYDWSKITGISIIEIVDYH